METPPCPDCGSAPHIDTWAKPIPDRRYDVGVCCPQCEIPIPAYGATEAEALAEWREWAEERAAELADAP